MGKLKVKLKIGAEEILIVLVAIASILATGAVNPLIIGALFVLYLAKSKLPAGITAALAVLILLIASPNFILYLLVLSLPGFLLTFLFGDDFSFLERFLLSFPLGMLFYIPLSFLSFVGFPINPATLVLIIVILPAILALRKKDEILSYLKGVSEKDLTIRSDLIYALVILIFLLLVWSPLLNDTKLPRTAGTGYYYNMHVFVEGVTSMSRIPLWDAGQNLGFPIFTFDIPFHFFQVGIVNLMSPYSLNTDFNYLYFLSMYILSLGLYALAKRFGFGYASFAVPLLYLSNPILAQIGVLTGYSKTMAALAFVPMLFIILHIAMKKPRYYILAALVGSVIFLTHPHMLTFGILFWSGYFIAKRFFFERRLLSKNEVLHILAFLAITLVLLSYSIAPVLLNQEYKQPGSFTYPQLSLFGKASFFEDYYVEPTKAYETFARVGLFYTLFAVIAAVVTFKKHKVGAFFIFAALFTTFFMYSPGIGPILKYYVETMKLKLFYLLAFSFSISSISIAFRKKGILLLIPIIIFSAYYGDITHFRVNDWYSEQAQTGLIYQQEMEVLSKLPDGRVITFGSYGTVVDMVITVLTEKPSMGHANQGGQHTNIFWLKIYSETTRGIVEGRSPVYVLNILRSSYNKYIFIDACSSKGGYDSLMMLKDYNLSLIYTDQKCNFIFGMDGGGFAEKVKLSKIELDEEAVYGTPGGYKVIGLKEPTGDYDYVISAPSDIALIEEPIPLAYERPNAEKIIIRGDFSNDWVVVKEEIFSRWHAYIAGEEVPIHWSNLGFMLIHAESGSEIILEHKPFAYDIIFSLIASLLIFLILWKYPE